MSTRLMRFSARVLGVTALAAGSASLVLVSPALASGHDGPGASELFVAPNTAPASSGLFSIGADGRRDHGGHGGCASAAYSTIGAAVAAAANGQTIVVCPGTYTEDVVLPSTKTLTLRGLGDPVIDATGFNNGFQVLSSGSTVQGFTVEHATGEGILVGALPGQGGQVSGVAIRDNTVEYNDLGNPTTLPITTSSYGQCNETPQAPPAPPIPGDCGEGIHLLSATNSTVAGNTVKDNSGGVLLTDENGPNSANLVAHNVVADNRYDCGVTVAGHNIAAFGGISGNTIADNSITGNGIDGEGGGVLLATPVPGGPYGVGGSVFNNVVEGNFIAGNGLAGITIHSHGTGQNLNGNVVRANVIGVNNLDPDHDYAFAGPDFIDHATTGIIVATLSNIAVTIEDNSISGDVNGIWFGELFGATVTPTPADPTSDNVFSGVTNDLVTVTH